MADGRIACLGLAATLLLSLAAVARAGEELPPGPPWHEDWLSAKTQALEEGKPIFIYFTKKH